MAFVAEAPQNQNNHHQFSEGKHTVICSQHFLNRWYSAVTDPGGGRSQERSRDPPPRGSDRNLLKFAVSRALK